MWKIAARNSLTIFTGSILSSLFMVLYRVYVIRALSVEDYARFAILTTIFTWILVFSHFDLFSAVSKYVSEYIATRKLDEACAIYRHAAIMALVFSILGVSLGMLLSIKQKIDAVVLIIFYAGLIPLTFITVSNGFLFGNNKFTWSAGINCLTGLSRLIVFIVLFLVIDTMRLSHILIAFSVSLLIPFFTILILNRKLGFHMLGGRKPEGVPVYRALFDYSKWVAITDLTNTGLVLANTYILSVYSMGDTAVFNVILALYGVFQLGYGSITSVLIPHVSQTSAHGELIRLPGMRAFLSLAAITLLIMAIIFLFPSKEKLLTLILNNKAYSQALDYLLILLMVLPFRIFTMVNKGIVQGLDDTKSYAMVAILSLFVNLLLIIPLYKIFGLLGVLLSMVAGQLIEFVLSQAVVRKTLISLSGGKVVEST